MKIASISIADYSECTEGMPHDVERLFFRMLLKMLSREGGLPDDDSDNARIFGYKDVRTYRALKAKLAAWPNAIVICDGMILNDRVESDLETYRDRKAAAVENGRIGGRLNKDQKKIAARSDGDRPEIDPRSSAEVETIPYATTNKNNELAKPSPSPTPSPIEKNISHTPVTIAARDDGPREGETEIAPGLFRNCKNIRHRNFVIDAAAIELQTFGKQIPLAKIMAFAEGQARQWAAEIANGKAPSQVVPQHIANFISKRLTFDALDHEAHQSKVAAFAKPKTQIRNWDQPSHDTH